MKLLAFVAVAALLVPASPGLASETDSHSFTATASSNSLLATPQIDKDANGAGPTVLTANNLEAVVGMGSGTDFLCGAASGLGLAIALSGVGAPVGIGLTAAGVACSMFL
jgi:hypothetical protein